MLEVIRPELYEMSFREYLMADEMTMSYNAKWGGTIPFPREEWEDWYDAWIRKPDNKRYYRYLKNEEDEFVGEIAYHYDSQRDIYICDVIILAKFRNRGYGTEGLKLLCDAAKDNGISVLHDDIAADNPSYKLFLKNGFEIEYQNDEALMVKKSL